MIFVKPKSPYSTERERNREREKTGFRQKLKSRFHIVWPRIAHLDSRHGHKQWT